MDVETAFTMLKLGGNQESIERYEESFCIQTLD